MILTLGLAGCAGAPAPAATHTAPAPTPTAPAAKAPSSGLIFVGCGFLFAGNLGRVPFSAFLPADEGKLVPGNEHLVILDGVLMELRLSSAAEVGAPDARGAELLQAYQRWETDHAAKTSGWPPLTPSGGPIELERDGVTAAMFGFDVPGPLEVMGATIDRVAYVTAAIDDTIFVMAVPLRPGDDLQPMAQKTRQILGTIERRAEPLDMNAVAAEIQRAGGAWKGCRQ